MFLRGVAPAQSPWLDSAARLFSPEYRRLADRDQSLRAELNRLPRPPISQQSERIGWHSRFARGANATKWLQIDLGHEQSFDSVTLVPVDAPYAGDPGPGFGFPSRFRVETSTDAAFSEPRLLVACDDADFPNPGNRPVHLATPGAAGRFVRITATRLWTHADLSLFALGEIFVWHAGSDIAAGAPVTASDTYNNEPVWEPANATDGQTMLGPPVEITAAPGNGWHAQPAKMPDVAKWVQVDLGTELPLDEVRLYPARPKDFPAHRGFGFPLRFRVEASGDREFSQPVALRDETQADFVNPAENPVIVPVHNVRARYVRVTATKLWERTNDYIFALAELEVRSGGRNVALGASVTSLDSIEAATWSRRFLVDGYNSEGRLVDMESWLRDLSRARDLDYEFRRLSRERERQWYQLASTVWRASIALLLLLAAVVAWWSVRRARRRRRELESLRQRIAGDLHDEIGSNLGSIALLSQMALRQPNGDARADLAEINRVARETAASMRDIVWLIKPGSSAPGDFAARLRETAEVMLRGIEWQFDAEALTRPLSLECQRQILLIFKEALHNIQKHASATHVTVRLSEVNGEFLMQITDNGKGFDVAATSSAGHGLENQHHRAASLGARLEITSSPTTGTTLTLRASH
jgi:signal transduction histidine kinase